MLLLIDNYDSFTFNIYQYLGMLRAKTRVIRNDQKTVEEILRLRPSGIVLSPGPGRPEDAGILVDLIKAGFDQVPMLGVCLGHQAIAHAFGGKVIRAKRMMHGKLSDIKHNKKDLHQGVKSPLTVTRYHSLVVDEKSLPSCLRVTASTDDGVIMAMRHKTYPVFGIQYHPESYMTNQGLTILGNFVRLVNEHA